MHEDNKNEEFNLEQMEEETAQMLRLRYLDRNNSEFKRTEGGFVSLRIGDEFYGRVGVYASFPFADPDKYISIREADEKAGEIGIIMDMNRDVDEDTRAMLKEQMDIRYFTPVISKINNIKDEYGFAYWDVETSRGRCKFTTRMNSSSVVYLTDTRLLITDLDENRFEIPDYTTLSARELKKLDLFL
ncbi:MAG: DUF1854 domain-containing protein [Lachnospiraceae bacterium]